MGQVIFLWFSPGIWQILVQQIFFRPTHLRRRKGHLDGFSSLATSRETPGKMTCKIDRLVFLRMYKNSLGRHLI